jgi:hypothetical protein
LAVQPEEIVLPFPNPIVPARHARSTILLGSQAAVRDAGRFEEYAALLRPTARDQLLNLVAGAWVPIELAAAHYEACEALGFPTDQQVQNGKATFDKTNVTLLGTVIRVAREAGVTPWGVVPHFQRFWERGYDGGGIGVWKTGPKEARMDIVRVPLNDSRYYRNAVRGLSIGVFGLFCAKAYSVERPGSRTPGSISLRIQWA